MEKLVETVDYTGDGFKPVWICGSWRLAINNDCPASRKANIRCLSRHLLTDESFTLLNGRARLHYAPYDAPEALQVLELNPGETSVVRAGVWHVLETFPGAKLLIAENADTGEANSEKYPVSCL